MNKRKFEEKLKRHKDWLKGKVPTTKTILIIAVIFYVFVFSYLINYVVNDDTTSNLNTIENFIKEGKPMEIKTKIELKDKNPVANLPIVKQMLIELSWSTNVDLDLMAFFKKVDNTNGGIFTNNLGGSHGELNAFPFMQLSGDEGVEATGGDNTESIRLSKIDSSIEKLYFVALNYTDAKNKNTNASFLPYAGKITAITDTGEAFETKLDSPEKGVAALICTIENKPTGAVIKRENLVFDLHKFVDVVPGAKLLMKD